MRSLVAVLIFASLFACSARQVTVREWNPEKRRGFVGASVDPMKPLPEPLVAEAQKIMAERCAGPVKIHDEGISQQVGAPTHALRDPFDRDRYGRPRPMFRQWDDGRRVGYVYLWDFSCVEPAPAAPPPQ